jgi:6-phosphogluconolactonase
MNQRLRWHVYPSSWDLVRHATTALARCADQAIAERGAFRVVLAGGSTPRAIYRALRDVPGQWSRWHVYFGDERCVPAGDPDRNDGMAAAAWLNHVDLPPGQCYRIPAERGAEAAANAYAATVADVDMFDLVLLGLGEDGHTASLFPGREAEDTGSNAAALAVHHAPKPPVDRVSLSAARLSRARQVLFLVTGAAKRDAISRWRSGKALPAASINPDAGVDVLVDTDAYGD